MSSAPQSLLLARPPATGTQSRGAVRPCGFTLIEMLVVVAVIALVSSAIAPMVFGTLMSTRITSAGETLASQIALAHQLAVSGNQEVEVRLYQYQDLSSPGTASAFRAVALVKSASDTGGTLGRQLTDTYYLPAGIIISNAAMLSPPLSVLPFAPDKEGIIKKVPNATFRAFHFYPDGSTDMPEYQLKAKNSYFTLGEERVIVDGTVPKNFDAVQIDPNTGRVVPYRP